MALLIFPIVMIALTWFLLVRPQQRRLREREALVASLEPGDTVVTAGGLHGVIIAIDDETLTLEAAPGVELTFDLRAIGRVERPHDVSSADTSSATDDLPDDDADDDEGDR